MKTSTFISGCPLSIKMITMNLWHRSQKVMLWFNFEPSEGKFTNLLFQVKVSSFHFMKNQISCVILLYCAKNILETPCSSLHHRQIYIMGTSWIDGQIKTNVYSCLNAVVGSTYTLAHFTPPTYPYSPYIAGNNMPLFWFCLFLFCITGSWDFTF